jgi:delta1-piperideine-2-carboxylate reductase
MADRTRLTLDQVHELSMQALMACGADQENAEAVTHFMWAAERDSCHSHGLFRLPGYAASLKSGKVNGKSRPTVEDLAPAAIRVNGDNGYAPMALHVGRDPLIQRARETGIAAASLTNTYHFSALWVETAAIAEQGLVAIAMTSAMPMVAPAGGTKPLFGTNPLSFAWPRSGQPPMVFDMATAAMARGEIQVAAREGHTVRDGAGIDKDGNPTNDPNAILEGAQLAFGGAKGALLALMVELMAGPMLGQPFSVEQKAGDSGDGGPATGGEFMIAIDPVRLSGNPDVLQHAEKLFDALLAQPGTRLPATRRYQVRPENEANGIEIPTALYDTIKSLT